MAKHTAVLADPHAIFRRGMRDLLDETGVEVIGEAEDLEALLPLLRRNPTVVFVDNAFADRVLVCRASTGTKPDCINPDSTRIVGTNVYLELNVSSADVANTAGAR